MIKRYHGYGLYLHQLSILCQVVDEQLSFNLEFKNLFDPLQGQHDSQNYISLKF